MEPIMSGNMVKCPDCDANNEAGTLSCLKCGFSLEADTANESSEHQTLTVRGAVSEQSQKWGATYFSPKSRLLLFPPRGDMIYVQFTSPIMTLGRCEPGTRDLGRIDLSRLNGRELGVSRQHAQLERTDNNMLYVTDLGSDNGTFLNGVRLEAHKPTLLRNRFELQLGALVFRVLFS
jgi:pSer/pThr/pTyr-binding forkhead associated (FHA) protein